MQTNTTFDASGLVLVRPDATIAVTADARTRKAWAYIYSTEGGSEQVVVKMPDGSTQVLADVMLPTPEGLNQTRLDVRVAVVEVPLSSVPVKPAAEIEAL